jgi:hypothetical protein
MNPVRIVHSTASVDILNNAAVKFIHGDIDGDVYLEKLKDWVTNSVDKISKGESEIPLGLPQGDLYCKSFIYLHLIKPLIDDRLQCVPVRWMPFKGRWGRFAKPSMPSFQVLVTIPSRLQPPLSGLSVSCVPPVTTVEKTHLADSVSSTT